MKIVLSVLITTLLLINIQAIASKRLTGQVVDSDSIGIPLATIRNNNTDTYLVAQEDGSFEIEAQIYPLTLEISAIGYQTRTFIIHKSQVEIFQCVLNLQQYAIDQVVVTGTLKPTPIDQSIYNISLIDQKTIKQRGSLQLNELLSTERNIRLDSDLILGSQIEMMGIGGENVKVLIDGVPIVGRLDGNIDLSQINLDYIEQVEIVEGPMSVVYGNNALAGTINLITKKTIDNTMEMSVNGSAETIGRYNTHVNYMQRINTHTISANAAYDYFGGVDFDDDTRSKDWRPKQMINTNGLWMNQYKHWTSNVKIGYFFDKLWDMSDVTDGYKAFDTYYYTQRVDLSAQLSGQIKEKHHISGLFAINHYNRLEQDVYKDLRTLETDASERISSQKAREIILRGVYEHTLEMGLKIQSGIDLLHEEMHGPRITDSVQSIADYALFFNGNQSFANALDLQIGMRYAHNSDYKTPLIYSLNTKWDIHQNLNWRISVAKGFRAPSIKELHYLFVDSNHQIYGNSELKPESSNSANTSFDWTIQRHQNRWTSRVMMFYNDIENKIDLIQDDSSINYIYQNIDRYKTHGLNTDFGLKHKQRLTANVGYVLTGRYNDFSEADFDAKTHYTHDLTASFSIQDDWSKGRWSADYKFTGELPYYYTDALSQQIEEGFQESYHLLNVHYSRTFFESIDFGLSLKNLMDVQSLERSGTTQVGDHSTSGLVSVSYGRSAFLNIKYTIKK